MRRATVAGLLLLAVWPPSEAATSERPTPAEIAGAFRSVVSVLPQWAGRPPSLEEPEGSGVVVGDGTTILTADHVLGDSVDILVSTSGGEVLQADIARRDPLTDLALLVVDEALPAIAFGGPVLPGEEVCAIGNAFGLGLSVVCGTVSAVERSGTGFNYLEDFIQVDAAVNPGMSGGALISEDGQLAGILSAIFTKQSDANIGVNFAVSAALAEAALQRFMSPDPVSWPQFGAIMRPHPPHGEPGPSGAAVMAVERGSVAESAGLMRGDIVLEASGRLTDSPEDITAALALAQPGETLRLTVLRGDARLMLEAPVAE